MAISLAVLVLAHFSPPKQPAVKASASKEARHDNGVADASALCIRAKTAVRERLNSPSSAVFPSCHLPSLATEYRITGKRYGTAYVRGYVDAQNVYGAMVRRDFIVELRNESPTQVEIGQSPG